MGVTISIIQPNYLPWLGYLDMIRRADVHVFYDDEQFARKGRANRAQVRGAGDKPEWLSVPVLHGQGFPNLCQAAIGGHGGKRWYESHLGKLRAWYRDAPYVGLVDEFGAVISEPYRCLSDLNIAVIEWLCEKLEITTPMQRCSLMDIPHDFGDDALVTTLRPLEVCKRLGAERFLCGPTAKAYIHEPYFTHAGVEIVWHDFAAQHPVYAQHRAPFMPFLSALDYLLEQGPGAFDRLFQPQPESAYA